MNAQIVMDRQGGEFTVQWLVIDLDALIVLERFPIGELKQAYAAQERYNVEMNRVC